MDYEKKMTLVPGAAMEKKSTPVPLAALGKRLKPKRQGRRAKLGDTESVDQLVLGL